VHINKNVVHKVHVSGCTSFRRVHIKCTSFCTMRTSRSQRWAWDCGAQVHKVHIYYKVNMFIYKTGYKHANAYTYRKYEHDVHMCTS